jgi:alkylation response protein AidB-like acyl-CoA dehydrogenase
MNESLISLYYRDARAASIAGGTDEVTREVVARLAGL